MFEAFFAFWPCENWGEDKKWERERGEVEKKRLAANPTVLFALHERSF